MESAEEANTDEVTIPIPKNMESGEETNTDEVLLSPFTNRPINPDQVEHKVVFWCETCAMKIVPIRAAVQHLEGKPHQKKLRLLNPLKRPLSNDTEKLHPAAKKANTLLPSNVSAWNSQKASTVADSATASSNSSPLISKTEAATTVVTSKTETTTTVVPSAAEEITATGKVLPIITCDDCDLKFNHTINAIAHFKGKKHTAVVARKALQKREDNRRPLARGGGSYYSRGGASGHGRGGANDYGRGGSSVLGRGGASNYGRLGANERGRGGANERGRGGANERGRGGVHERGRGGANERGRGGANERGRGGASVRGRGGASVRGRGGANERGRGGAIERGRGGAHEHGRSGGLSRGTGGGQQGGPRGGSNQVNRGGQRGRGSRGIGRNDYGGVPVGGQFANYQPEFDATNSNFAPLGAPPGAPPGRMDDTSSLLHQVKSGSMNRRELINSLLAEEEKELMSATNKFSANKRFDNIVPRNKHESLFLKHEHDLAANSDANGTFSANRNKPFNTSFDNNDASYNESSGSVNYHDPYNPKTNRNDFMYSEGPGAANGFDHYQY